MAGSVMQKQSSKRADDEVPNNMEEQIESSQRGKLRVKTESKASHEMTAEEVQAFPSCELLIVGGGPAGLAAAVSACDAGVTDILIIERDAVLGGILNQCIHNGFGLHTFKEELTGPEYAKRYEDMVKERNIDYELNTMTLDITPVSIDGVSAGCLVTTISKDQGLKRIFAQAIILAMGCRERPRGALNIPGNRGAGIFSAGTAQRFVNLEGEMPGSRVFILGSGDIGLIMARRMVLEGAKVLGVAELMPFSGGLKRNIVQCLDDFGIPLFLSHTVVDIKGKERVESVTIAQVDENMKPILGTEKEFEVDTLLLSCGLLPENELSAKAGIELSPTTKGALVDNSLQTSIPGIFACGNVLHVHDLVDYVSQEATLAGACAAQYLQERTAKSQDSCATEDSKAIVHVIAGNGVSYTVPSILRLEHLEETTTIRFRVRAVFSKAAIQVTLNGNELQTKKRPVMAPGEMEQVILKCENLLSALKRSRETGHLENILEISIVEGA